MTMKQKANASLILLAVLFAGAATCLYLYPGEWWTRFLLYVAEAGLVGALADLFAVTVLFRHPFGWKWVPHTAIIPRNRDKLVEGVTYMVEEQLLNKELIRDKMKQFRLVEAFIAWADSRPDGRRVSDLGWQLLHGLIRRLDTASASAKLDKHARKALQGVNLSAYAGKALKWILNNQNIQAWLGYIVDYAAKLTEGDSVKEAIRDMLAKEKDKFVNEGGSLARWFKQKLVDFAESADAINLDDAARTLHQDLKQFMEQLKRPDHELRVMLENQLHVLADRLSGSDDIAAAVDVWKLEVLEQISLQPTIGALLDTIKGLLEDGAEMKYIVTGDGALRQEDVKAWFVKLLASYWEWFKQDEETKLRLESYAQQFVRQVIETEHAVIGRIVRKTLGGFTEERLVRFIESKVDTDLQRIRLNGAFIGAAVGALLYGFLHGIYAPLLDLF
ncbi:DUF445 domain-containing protein [Paenibacillus sp. LHD-117]|uniref:DUF445 domain-containing protein n=1 Tax=Paenibacillus sp. LHD-117 TaxID=3071412 RepID=UPI0027DECE92|nr:DUF445 domain-containing protein [Paenibacillus sp. LHD-117]MDQ6418530.1 DUF445 domain-containing protein [Paenibacillus sp. LHD-117]